MNVGKGYLSPQPLGKRGRWIEFGFSGLSDIIGQLKLDGRILAIEVKSAGGQVSPSQAAFLDLVRQHGGVAGVVRSIEDAEKLLCSSR